MPAIKPMIADAKGFFADQQLQAEFVVFQAAQPMAVIQSTRREGVAVRPAQSAIAPAIDSADGLTVPNVDHAIG